MAEHINQGQPIPTFFYGQPYMGSLDALLVSLAFRLLGETVLAIRLVQFVLYVLLVTTTMWLALRISGKRRVALIAGLLIALPSTLVTLYTTISLGGYGEVLVIGNLVLLMGLQIESNLDGGLGLRPNKVNFWLWLVLGALIGLGWWTHNLIIVYILPVALVLIPTIWRSTKRPWPVIRAAGLALVAFFIFSAPWWIYNLSRDWESVHFLLGSYLGPKPAPGLTIGPVDKAIGLVAFGLPTIMGLRYPWTQNAWAGWLTVPIMIAVLALLGSSIVREWRKPGIRLLAVMLLCFTAVFILSSFGVDATGRYLLPLAAPMAMLAASSLLQVKRKGVGTGFALSTIVPATLIVVMIAVNLLGTILAMRNVPPGLTPQFDAATDFTNDFDQQAIAFLKAHGGQYGYATYWAAYRLVFLSGETIIQSPKLPYKANLLFTDADRYPAYTTFVEQAPRPVLVTANLPQLDSAIVQALDSHHISYSRQAIGPYTIFYDLSEKVNPAALGLQSLAIDP